MRSRRNPNGLLVSIALGIVATILTAVIPSQDFVTMAMPYVFGGITVFGIGALLTGQY